MASGDKFYLADKATLDEVKGKIGSTNDAQSNSTTVGSIFAKLNYLVSQVSGYLSSIFTFVSRIGATNDAQSSSTTTGSIFAKLNYLVNQIGDYLLSIYNNTIKIGTTTDTGGTATTGTVMAKGNAILTEANKIGGTTDTEGTNTTGTVMGKLNKIISKTKYKFFKYFNNGDYYIASNQTNVTVLSISGEGEFYGFYGNPSSLTVIVDGVTYTVGGDGSGTNKYIFRFSIYGLAFFGIGQASTSIVNEIHFKQSLIIKVNTGSSGSPVGIAYALYE